jgi:hypothetical protein
MRTISLEQLGSILSGVGPNPRVVVSGNFATPYTLLNAVDSHLPEYRLHMLNAHGRIPKREGVTYETAFIGPAMRDPQTQYIPARLSMLPLLLKRDYRPDIVLIQTSPKHHDTVSLGIECNVMPAAIEATREHGGIVIAQANPQMPYTYGDAQIYENEIDYLIECEEDLTTIEPGPLDDTSRQIGELIATRINNGSTLQLGIGAVPDAVVQSLHQKKGFRVWTEMFSDGVLGLHKSGSLDDDVPLTASFIFGSRELYDWLNKNKKVRIMRTEVTNNPGNIERQAQMTSVNAALQVDLFDQANAVASKVTSIPASAAAPTSSWERCIHAAVSPLSPCRPGIRKPTSRPSSRSLTNPSPASNTALLQPNKESRTSSAEPKPNRPATSSSTPRTRMFATTSRRPRTRCRSSKTTNVATKIYSAQIGKRFVSEDACVHPPAGMNTAVMSPAESKSSYAPHPLSIWR